MATKFSIRAAKAIALGALTVATVATVSPMASAAGTSGKTNGCYSTWGNTAFTGHCNPATVTGQYANHGECDWQADDNTGYYRWSAGFVGKWGTGHCTFKVTRSYILFSAG
ncbi:hypothetical protein WKI68_11630 [Streptomyces sp. MS1.HAVA.3]|uniref:Uncharacterized protein n=1 Tax=Streptomyces caledonius TaxID=3134107 RepID=A0ABU8U230_9ACTN